MFDPVKMVLRGEEIEVPGNRVTLIRPARELYRIEWQPIPSEDGRAALYSQRWEGSPSSLQSHIVRLSRSVDREKAVFAAWEGSLEWQRDSLRGRQSCDDQELLELGKQLELYVALQDLLKRRHRFATFALR